MAPNKLVASKRKTSGPPDTQRNGTKKSKITNATTDPRRKPHAKAQETEDNGIVLRTYYPHEMSNARALAYNKDELPRPIELLNEALADTKTEREKVEVKDAVVHWYKCDLRTKDNHALFLASEKAKEKGVPLICIVCIFRAPMFSNRSVWDMDYAAWDARDIVTSRHNFLLLNASLKT
jgi:deoxyribodipyrimidine photo-lyase